MFLSVQVSIEWVSAYPLIFFLPIEIESVSTTSTDHYDLTVVHQISVPLIRSRTYRDNARKFSRGTSVTHNIYC